MKKNKIILIIIIILLIIIIGGYFIIKNKKEKSQKNEIQDYTPQEEISEEQLRQTKITLFFINKETKELDSEIRLIDAKELIKEPYKKIVEMLISGPKSSNLERIIPEGVQLHDVKYENGCAVINVSKEILDYQDEKQKQNMINSIVKTLNNLIEIDGIKFLINGEENEKLNEIYTNNIAE